MKISKGKQLFLLGFSLVVIDQLIKVLVKLNMSIGEHFSVFGDWFQIFFIENEGMAFGMQFGGSLGKLLLSLFRIVLFCFLFWWISKLAARGSGASGKRASCPFARIFGNKGKAVCEKVKSSQEKKMEAVSGDSADMKVPTGVLIGLTMITAGAFGNILDSLFYGLIFSASEPGIVASFGGGYAPFLFGKVVDMFYFPLIDTTFPSWFPFIGGHPFRFFEPVFNFADSCVTVGAIYLILFQYRFFSSEDKRK